MATENEQWQRWNAQAERITRGRAAMKAKEEAAGAREAEKEAERQAKATAFLEPDRAEQVAAGVRAARARRMRTEQAATEADDATKPKAEPVEASAGGGGGAMDPGTAAQERGKRDFAAGMGLITEAGRTVSVTSANPTHGAVKGYTDTMGHGAQREGRFVGARPQGQVAAEQAPAAPVQVVVQAPPAAPTPPRSAGTSSPTPVPAGALPAGLPGQVPSSTPSTPIPLEGDPEVVAADQAKLDEQLAAMTPEQQAEWLRKEGERLDQAAPSSSQVPAGAVPEGAPGSELDKGVLQREMNAAEDLSQAKVDLAQTKADALTDAAAQTKAALEEQRAAEADEAERVQAQLDARKQADSEIATATRTFSEAQTLTPQKAWASMGAGRRVAFAITALAAGLRGSADPLAAVRAGVASEVDAQEAAIGKLGANLDAARSRGDSAAAVYENVLQQVGDARQARSITEVARLNQIKADFEARLATEGVQVLSAEQQAFLTGLEEEIAGKQMAIDVQTARNPRTITRSANVYGKGAREAMRLGGKAMMESGAKGIERGEEFAGKAALQGMELESKAALEREKQAATKADRTEIRIGEEMRHFADKTEAAQQTAGLIDQMLEQDDIAGYATTAGPTVGNAANNTEDDIKAIAESFGRLQSQGVISPDEEVRFLEMLKGGTGWGGEKRLRQNLKRVKGMVNLKIKAQEKSLSPEARAYYRRNKNLPDFEAQWTGGTGESVVKVDE